MARRIRVRGMRSILVMLMLAFTVVPLIELGILIKIGQYLGVWATLGVVVLTGVLGSGLAASQGLRAVRQIREDVLVGRMPTYSILDGVLVLSAGLLLLTPGLLTDSAGFFLLVPPGRRLVRGLLKRWLRSKVQHYVHPEEGEWE
jgi:UPF0716 protein FxsA